MARGSWKSPTEYRLYTEEQRQRRDSSVWTLVQGILAPLQFVVCILSAILVVRFLMTGAGYEAATLSVLVKTGFLFLIMITGAIWEKEVFGQYLFAPAFFWEDVVSFGVIALHTAYVWGLITGAIGPAALMWLALVAYAAYVVNAAQFLWKLRLARLSAASATVTGPEVSA
ncbi:2-vinyl bacteriochlorophyllide hydratase [Pararhodobacter sp. SW119]|uniref:2-vinyl bacteriochlorophyllide hydratase n=1 Tax=Pararhodobacter sp. SW119 TaxID=2780075 RepID=UPI001ADEE063|nr:2-vinyl bacteriochlorophyllide hydratase [Pararhodobacter sp. SW119]